MNTRNAMNIQDAYDVMRAKGTAETIIGLTTIRHSLYHYKGAKAAHRAAQALVKALEAIEAENDGKSI